MDTSTMTSDSSQDSLLSTIEYEIKEMIKMAAECKQMINSAKTQTKKAYYKKKLTQIVSQVDQVMKAVDSYKSKHTDTTTPESVGVKSVIRTPVYDGTSSEVIGDSTLVTLG